jgi:hypothetical protein
LYSKDKRNQRQYKKRKAQQTFIAELEAEFYRLIVEYQCLIVEIRASNYFRLS